MYIPTTKAKKLFLIQKKNNKRGDKLLFFRARRGAPKYYTTAASKNQFAKCTNFGVIFASRFIHFDENFFQKTIDNTGKIVYNIVKIKERGIKKMFFDDFDLMITPEEIFDYSELLEEIEM